jgi:serine-type D-Ala-D-Ala carboxypeptidase/endopeptidase (penicillin-binding protein 4)
MMLRQNAIERLDNPDHFNSPHVRLRAKPTTVVRQWLKETMQRMLLLNSFRRTFALSANKFSRMKKLLVFSLLILGGCSSSLPRQTPSDPFGPLRRDINAVLSDSIFRHTLAGVKIVSLNTGEVFYQKNDTLLMHPASNLKLLTSATALQILGEGFSFKTAVLVDSVQSGGVIPGDVYIKGFGDPDLKTSDLDSLAATLHSVGIRAINGDVVADDSYFDDLYWGKGWMWDDEPDPDEMFISALSVNKNCVSVNVAPGLMPGNPAIVTIDPPTPFFSVLNNARTGVDSSDYSVTISRLFKERLNTITVDGTLPQGCGAHRSSLSVWQPALYTAELFRESLQRDSIAVLGYTRLGTTPLHAVELANHGWPIDSVLITMNKFSDNLSAENLLKTIGARQRGLPGTARNGIYAENEFLSSFGIDTSACSIVDGSGVSHYNLLTVDDITRLLAGIAKRPDPFHVIYASLPVAGIDGTLESRMIGTAAQGTVRAKTGTISGVSAMSGYVTTSDGELLAFSMVMENFVTPTRYYQGAQDRICGLLARFSRKRPASASR